MFVFQKMFLYNILTEVFKAYNANIFVYYIIDIRY